MASSKFEINLLPLILLVFGLTLSATTVVAVEMDHSKMNMGKDNETDDEEDFSKENLSGNSHKSKWPVSTSKGVDAWSTEEFANEALLNELNTEIGVVIHHQHKSGNWMVSYKYMNMYMDGLIRGTAEREGNEKVSTEDVARADMTTPGVPVANFNYIMAPLNMTMKMHMLMAMYGYSDNTSFMFMTNYLQNDMNMVMHMGNENMIMSSRESQMATSGVSDTVLTMMVKASDAWIISFGLSLPTGSIDEQVVMAGNTIQAPYKMQLGSGTLDFQQSVTYKGGDSSFNWGMQESFTYRSGANTNGYVLGNRFEINAWVRKTFSNQFSISTRLKLFDEGAIEGRDSKIMNSSMSPTFDTVNSGRHQSDLSIGFSKRFDSGHRLGFEYSKPIAQVVQGIQMETKYAYTLSWSYMLM